MKKLKIWSMMMLMVMALPLMVACGGDDDDVTTSPSVTPPHVTEPNDSYYVKYEVQSGDMVSYADHTTRTITFTDVDGNKSVTVKDKAWDGTYGPFKKQDQVKLFVTTNGRFNSNGRISVSRNKEPFVVKAETMYKMGIMLEYTIDF